MICKSIFIGNKNLFRIVIILFSVSIITMLNCCSGCSKSGINSTIKYRKITKIENYSKSEEKGQTSAIKMEKKDGVYMVPVEINGISMEFIFDTGASDIMLSATEAVFLYKQGKLSQEDILGTRKYQIADGTIAEGTVIILKNVRIGNKTLNNVQASVVNNIGAPLLMGQSALSRFGKITIDYNNNEIKFE